MEWLAEVGIQVFWKTIWENFCHCNISLCWNVS